MTVLLVCLQLSVVSSQLEGETFVYAAAAQNNGGVAARSQRHLLALRQDVLSQGSRLSLTPHPRVHSHPHTHLEASPKTTLDPNCSPCTCGHLGIWPSGEEPF